MAAIPTVAAEATSGNNASLSLSLASFYENKGQTESKKASSARFYAQDYFDNSEVCKKTSKCVWAKKENMSVVHIQSSQNNHP